MTLTLPPNLPTLPKDLDWEDFIADLGGIEVIRDRPQVEKLSKDYYYFSPILVPLLGDKVADLVVRPQSEAEVLQVAKTCVAHRVPLTVRGAGTGNYGQCIPLAGGVILDLSGLNQVQSVQPGRAWIEAGAKLSAIDKVTRPQGWELRMYPSTYRTATLGGFIGGGSGGIGSVTYGQLRDPGNLLAVRVVTLEDEPQILELRGEAVQQVNHAYGTNGIITALEIPLAPAYPWIEAIVTFPDFMAAARFGQALGDADGLIKKLISVHAWPIPSYFTALRPHLPEGEAAALVMIADCSWEPFVDWVNQWGGNLVYQKSPQEASKGIALGEYTWNHTTLHARNSDPSFTYLQTLFPYDPELALVGHMVEHFGDEVLMHLEYLRVNGKTIPAGLQLVRYSTPERLQEIITYHEAQGAFIANPHTYVLEDGGRKAIDQVQVDFKAQVDPHGLLNPGKMRGWWGR